MIKHHIALNLFLIAVAASNFNPVASQSYTPFPDRATLQTAVNTYCSGGTVDPKYGPSIKDWDVSQITSMSTLFRNKGSCNPPIGNWTVTKVTSFHQMFEGATSFNQDIGGWDVGSVNRFHHMFKGATSFNQDIGDWDVGSGIYFREMFNGATSFNQDLSGWDVSSNQGFDSMFEGATSFNQDLSGWDVSSGTFFLYMFQGATAFNQNIGGWNVSSGFHFQGMFQGATAFNQDISGWDVASGQHFHNMFDGATSFNQTSIYCNWQSNDYFKNDPNVCNNGANCGWGQNTSCLVTPAPVPAPTSPPPTTPAAPTPPSPPTTLVPTISLATKYFIALVENSTVARFNDTNSANEITFNLNITESDLGGFNGESVTVLEYETCSGEAYAESVVSAVPDIPNKMIDGIYAEVPILVDINTTDIENISSVYPGYFNATNEETAILQFCVMSKLGESTIYNSTSNTTITTAISYSKVKVQVEIDMKKGFESASVSVTEDNPKEEVAESTVDYELNACECDDAGACIDASSSEAKTQNSLVNVCVYTSVENDVIIEKIKDMRIYSGTLEYNAISNSEANPITVTKRMGAGKISVVTTRLVGAFFTDLAEGETNLLNIDGTAVLKFAASSPSEPASRKLVRVRSEVSNDISDENGKKDGNSRTLEDGFGTFEMDMEIGNGVGGDASASDAYNDGNVSPLVLALQSLVMGGVSLLLAVL